MFTQPPEEGVRRVWRYKKTVLHIEQRCRGEERIKKWWVWNIPFIDTDMHFWAQMLWLIAWLLDLGSVVWKEKRSVNADHIRHVCFTSVFILWGTFRIWTAVKGEKWRVCYEQRGGKKGRRVALKGAFSCHDESKKEFARTKWIPEDGFFLLPLSAKQTVVTMITSATKSVPTTPHVTDHCPLFCIPIKSGSLLATVHSGTLWPHPPPPIGQRRLTTAYCGPIVMVSREGPDLCGHPSVIDAGLTPSSGLSQRFWWTCSCN